MQRRCYNVHVVPSPQSREGLSFQVVYLISFVSKSEYIALDDLMLKNEVEGMEKEVVQDLCNVSTMSEFGWKG